MELKQEEAGPDLLEQEKILKEQLNIIRSRLYLLDGEDRRIMSMYIVNGISYRQIALLLGASTSSVSRKIKRIMPKLTEGIFISCLNNHEQFTQAEIAIARDYFIKGFSIKKIARKRNTSFYKIRETLREIRLAAADI